jgi:hypothetical protein
MPTLACYQMALQESPWDARLKAAVACQPQRGSLLEWSFASRNEVASKPARDEPDSGLPRTGSAHILPANSLAFFDSLSPA